MFGLFFIMIYFSIKVYIEKFWTLLNVNPKINEDIILITPSILLTLLAIPILGIIITVSWLYQSVVKMILRLKLGKDYVRIITGCNLMTCLEVGREPPCITLMIIVKSDLDGEKFYNVVKNRFLESMKDPQFEPLYYLRGKFMDYIYLRKSALRVEEFVRRIEAKNERELVDFVNGYKMSDLPRDNMCNFDAAIGNKRLEDKGGYPVMVRVHHCLADGLSLYNIIRKLMCLPDVANDVYASNLSEKMQKSERKFSKYNLLKENIRTVFPSTYPHDIFKDRSSESGTATSFIFERVVKYVPLVKQIKSRMPGMSFNAILLGAFSASIAEYYKKKMPPEEIPEFISVGMPVQVKKERFVNDYSSKNPHHFINDFSICYYNMPIVSKSKKDVPVSEYLIDRLMFLKDEFSIVMKSPEIMVNYAYMKILVGVLPFTIVRLVYGMGSISASASSFPGGPLLHFFQGDKILEMKFFTPKLRNISLCLSVLTYDNRLQMSLATSKTRIQDVATLEEILNGVFPIIDILDEQTKLLYGNKTK